jgi:general secretion pathway protein I
LRGERGFTLIEVLIAFTITAFVLAAVLQLFSTGFRSTAAAEQQLIATMVAQSKLDELAAAQPLVAVERSGVTEAGYRWQASVRRFAELAAPIPDGLPVRLYELAVVVAWGPSIRPRTTRLTTLRVTMPLDAGEGTTE